MRWVWAVLTLVGASSGVRADFALPIPGCKQVPCEVEIEVPAELNGFRLYLRTPRRPVLELEAGTTHRLSDYGDSRDPSGYLLAVPERDFEFAEHDSSLSEVISHALSSEPGATTQITLRVFLHYLDPRSKAQARYRVDRVSPEGFIEMTTLHVDGSWTGWLCVGPSVALAASFLGLWLCLARRAPVPEMPAVPPVVSLRPLDDAGG